MSPSAGNVGRNKLALFRHRGRAFAVGLPEQRKLVPAYGTFVATKRPRELEESVQRLFLDVLNKEEHLEDGRDDHGGNAGPNRETGDLGQYLG